MISDLLFWCGATLLLYVVYKWYTTKNDYFEKRGVSSKKPQSLIDVLYTLAFKPKSLAELMTELYEENPGYK